MADNKIRHSKPLFFKFFALAIALMIFQVSFFVETLPVLASEEENIDDFAIHPAQRWNSISDEAADVITGDSYEIYSLNNATSGNTEFEKSRGLRTQDMKVSSLLKVDTGGNETEFFRDIQGNAVDFNEGLDGVQAFLGSTVSTDGGIMEAVLSDNANSGFQLTPFSQKISTEVFQTVRMRAKCNETISFFFRYLRDGGAIVTEFIVLTPDWQNFEMDISSPVSGADGNGLFVFKNSDATLATVHVDWIEITGKFDFASSVEGEIEDPWDWETDNDTLDWTGLLEMNVSDGFLNGTMAAASDDALISPPLLTIDTDQFDRVVLSINSSDESMLFVIQANISGVLQAVTAAEDLFNAQTVYDFDLSADTDWTGTANDLRLFFDETDGSLDGDEVIYIDYFLLTGNWSSDDGFALELLNQDQERAMAFKFTRNGTDNSEHELTISLWDASGSGFSSTTSFEYDQMVDGWLDLSFRLDTIEKQFKFDLKFENVTSIVNIDRFSDVFTNLPVNLKIFDERFLLLALNNTVGALSRSLVIIDFINAEFQERDWEREGGAQNDANWVVDSLTAHHFQDNVASGAEYNLVVPRLDSASCQFDLSLTNFADMANPDLLDMTLDINIVEKSTGDSKDFMSAFIVVRSNASNIATIHVTASGTVAGQSVTVDMTDDFVSAFVSFSLIEERTVGIITIWAIHDDFQTEIMSATREVTNATSDPSDEFIVSVDVNADLTVGTAGDGFMTVAGLTVVARERFSNFGPTDTGGKNPDGTGLTTPPVARNPLTALMQEIANILVGGIKFVADALIVPALIVISGIAGTIFGVLTTIAATLAGLAVATATAVWTNIETILDFLVDAITDIAADIWVAFGTVASDIMDDIITALVSLASDVASLLDDVIQFLLPLLTAIATDIADFLFAVVEFLIVLIIDIAEAIWNVVAAITFFVWDAFGLPDLIAILTYALTGIVGLIGDAVANLTWFTDALFAWGNGIFFLGVILLLAIPVFSSRGGGELMEKMVQANSWDILPVGVLGFEVHVPVGLVFWPLLFLVVFLL